MREKIDIIDHRCPGSKENGCIFPNCPCEYPPHTINKPDYIQPELIFWIGMGIMISYVISLSLTALHNFLILN